MARRFARRKPRVLWLPVLGNDLSTEPEVTFPVPGAAGSLVVEGDGSISSTYIPVTFDRPVSAARAQDNDSPFDNPTQTLHDVAQGNAYRLRRIVGKCFITQAPDASTSAPCLDVAAGFIVKRVNDSGVPLFPGTPLSQDAAEDPWIWRRRWMLGLSRVLGAWTGLIDQTFQAYPSTTAGYGSVADGPHIDQKTARLISNDEQLFFYVAARVAGNSIPYTTGSLLLFDLDIRLLASLRSQISNRRNASR